MGSDHVIEPKGKVQPKPVQESAEPEKAQSPLTKPDVQGKLDAQTLTRMQQTVGNAAVQRFLAQRQQSGPSDINDETAEAIQSKKGSGNKLDSNIAEKAGGAMGQDFSSVNVHTDSQSDTLNRELGAKAFTTGNDIFFQSGAYDPGSSDGQRLISHELTHVVQQGGSGAPVQGKMSVNDPNDSYEAEADKVADMVMNSPDEAVAQRQDERREEEIGLRNVTRPCNERRYPKRRLARSRSGPPAGRQKKRFSQNLIQLYNELHQKKRWHGENPIYHSSARKRKRKRCPKLDPALQRQEEDELMTKLDPALQRQEEEEKGCTKARPALQRQEEEEEMMQPKLDPTLQRQEEEEMAM